MKYCVNCKWQMPHPHSKDLSLSLCQAAEPNRDLVTGEVEGDNPYPFCKVVRMDLCGKDARLYQEKDVPNV